MSRVQYWAQHLDMAKLLGDQEKRAAKEAAKETCPTCHKKFVTLARHKCKKRPREATGDEVPSGSSSVNQIQAEVDAVLGEGQ